MFAYAAVIVFLFVAALGGVATLLILNKRPLKVERDVNEGFRPLSEVRHVDEVIDYDDVKDGIIYRKGRCYGLARVEGVNFSVMSQEEQNAREAAVIEIFNGIDYPFQFITTTVVADTTSAAQEIAAMASMLKECSLKRYMTCYAGVLQQMKQERRVLSQQTYMVISSDGGDGPPKKVIRERMRILQSALMERVGIYLTPLLTTEEVLSAIQQVVLPDQLVTVQERIAGGVCAPIHFSHRDFTGGAEEVKSEYVQA